ncbi:MAG: RHS repeat protein [Xanthomonadales bacterium]|nr:RHS repeat protein [Xanthomonadales bacterium]
MNRKPAAIAQESDEASPQSWLSSFLGRGFAACGRANLKRGLRSVVLTALMIVCLTCFSAAGIVHSSGVSIPFTRDSAGRIVRISLPDGQQLNNRYDASGDLIESKDQIGYATTISCLQNLRYPHWLEEIRDPYGRRAPHLHGVSRCRVSAGASNRQLLAHLRRQT